MTKKLDIEKLNEELNKFDQKSKFTFYSANPKKLILNGITYVNSDVIKIIRRLTNSNKIWIENFDLIYLMGQVAIEDKIKSLICAKGGVACQKKHSKKIKKNLNTGIPWNKDKNGLQTAWNKGLTKNTDDRLKKVSNDRMGENNPNYGNRLSEEQKNYLSEKMKEKIFNGTFTPNSNNRNTHWESQYKDKKFRSSWEAIYYSNNQTDLYEDLRVKYNFNNKEYIYIVDFVNYNDRIATEIKPEELLEDEKTKTKLKALDIWCSENGFKLNIVTLNDILKLDVNLEDFDENTQRKIRAIYETRKKNRD
jgi:hypothetical protein